jgi:hypothetical protein
MHDVPTHLEVTGKLVFGLTAGQTLFCAAGVFAGYSLWRRLQLLGLPLAGSVPVAALASLALISLTLIRPEERSLDQWSFILLRYLFRPKVCLLAREELEVEKREELEAEETEEIERSSMACSNRGDKEEECFEPGVYSEPMSRLAP